MKRSFVFFCALMAGALSFSSCNKDLKDDLNELKRDAGVDEPLVVTTTFTDYKNQERKITGTLKYNNGVMDSDAMIKNPDGNYEIRIGRSMNLANDQWAGLGFYYDPATKKVLYVALEHYWEDLGFSNGHVEVYQNENPTNGLSFDLNIKSIDLESGNINLELKVEGTKEYASNNSWRVPNNNSGFTSVISFNGKLNKFDSNNPL